MKRVWPTAEAQLRADPAWPEIAERYRRALEEDENAAAFWDWLSDPQTTIGGQSIGLDSVWRLLYIQPDFLIGIFKTQELGLIAKHFAEFDKLMAIRRSPESELPGFQGGKLKLGSIMREHIIRTVPLDFENEQQLREHLAWHRAATQEYAAICNEYGKKGRGKNKSPTDSPPPVMAQLRKMAIAAASNHLSRLNHFYSERVDGGNTRVETIQQWRDSGLELADILELTTLNEVCPPRKLSRIGRLKRSKEGSPKMTKTMKHIHHFVLPKPGEKIKLRKLLITEEYPLIAYYWERILNELHILTEVLHSNLSKKSREHVIEEFREEIKEDDLEGLRVCILMYSINASGVNLDPACYRCIVSTSAINAAQEIQAFSRLIRVSQPEIVHVYRLCVRNSNDEWRDARQANKVLFTSATKAFSDGALVTLAGILNTNGAAEVQEVRESALGKKMLQALGLAGILPPGQAAEDPFPPSTMAMLAELRDRMQNPHDPDTLFKTPLMLRKEAKIASAATAQSATASDPTYNDGDFLLSLSVKPEPVEDADSVDAPQTAISGVGETDVNEEANNGTRRQNSPAAIIKEEPRDEDDEELGTEDNDPDSGEVDSGIYVDRPTADVDDDPDAQLDSNDLDLGTDLPPGIAAVVELVDHIYHTDRSGYEDYHNTTDMTIAWRSYWTENMTDPDARDTFDQNIMYVGHICTLPNPEKADYTFEDLKKPENSMLLKRALRLLQKQRFGYTSTSLRIVPYADYTALKGSNGADIVKQVVLKEMSEMEKASLEYAFGLEGRIKGATVSDVGADPVTTTANGTTRNSRPASGGSATRVYAKPTGATGGRGQGGIDAGMQARMSKMDNHGKTDLWWLHAVAGTQ
ncbi:unnamed protein product [Zymoseptoria tritici ST99CH_1E4]|uniref:Helicase C-terminal domain-containing protein n=1 Tax=Zymoseptoria tritici ST99CH_1E4 TaxID=1276532 RepID=A0A2H1GJ68_ZYMTR|nr:unnamed protein product [Zymoseptoria tritici ST99CH_1E4]